MREAAADSGGRGVLEAIDSFNVVHRCELAGDPAARLAERPGSPGRHGHTTGMGGTTPQLLVGTSPT